MNSSNFHRPQRQSKIGVILVFGNSLYHLFKNLWFLGIYFFMNELDSQTIINSTIGATIIFNLAFAYSILYFWRFVFYIDPKTEEFVLQKGVLNSKTISLPFHKIQQVNLKRNLVQRLIGVYSVLIDTAGSKEKEVEIKALSRIKAEQLAELLISYSRLEENIKEVEIEGKAAVDWHFSLNTFQLLKLGLISNYIRGLLLLITFYITLKDQFFLNKFIPPEFMMEPSLDSPLSVWKIILLLLAIITVTVADTFIKYYGLRLKKSNSGLQIEMGLRKNKKVSLKAKRVQTIEILNNPFQQKLDLQKVKFFLASSPNDPEKSIITIPGISQELLSKVLGYMHVNPIKKQVTQIIPNKLLIFKKISVGFLPLLLIPIISKFYHLDLSLKWMIIIISIYSVILFGYQLLSYRSLRLSFSEDFILKNSGVWKKKQQYLEIWKLQAVSMSQPLWYRKKNLVNLIFHSAGGDVSFELIDRNKAESLMDYVLYKIESTSKGWM